uniref:Uncharacterized protein n=1 Tax=Triticum urartu TaxID=4572 RepID=A0A8R7VDU8_TRIUA
MTHLILANHLKSISSKDALKFSRLYETEIVCCCCVVFYACCILFAFWGVSSHSSLAPTLCLGKLRTWQYIDWN